MTREEKYMREAGAWDCEQRSPHHKLASYGRKWCADLAVLLMADLSGQHPTYQIGEKLQQRGVFLQKLFEELERQSGLNQEAR